MSEKDTEHERLCNLKIHQSYRIDDHLAVMRVAGGWIYIYRDHGVCMTFVPYVSAFSQNTGPR